MKMNTRSEKKSETLEVRLPHSKKKAFQEACAEEGITASHAVRTFIDAYLKRSRRVKLKRLTQEISMTLIRNPIKSTGSVGVIAAAFIAAITLTTAPSTADDHKDRPIEYPRPIYPAELAKLGVSAECKSTFDVTPEGLVDTNGLSIDCSHSGFVESTRLAILTLRFEPKLIEDKPVWRRGVVYPIEYMIVTSDEVKKLELNKTE